MRGKDSVTLYRDHVVRITPAYAGKSSQCICERIETEDHPRLCGEKAFRLFAFCLFAGSPPPMRGKGFGVIEICFFVGITPAYAGKSSTKADLEKRVAGSPPPMRGKEPISNIDKYLKRITPAYAGKSSENRAFILIR